MPGIPGREVFLMIKEKSAQVRASMKYNAKNVRQIKINLNIKNDSDIIAKIDSEPNKQGYIKNLIRRDIAE